MATRLHLLHRISLAAAVELLFVVVGAAATANDTFHWGPTTSLGIGLRDAGCPPVSTSLLTAFVVGGAGDKGVLITKAQSAALACQLKVVLAHAADGNRTAQTQLTAIYQKWRQAYRPHAWHTTSKGSGITTRYPIWLENLKTVTSFNFNLSSRFWLGLNAYSDMTTEEFASSVLMSVTAPTSSNRKLLAACPDCGRPRPTSPTSINWLTAGKVLPSVGFQAQCASSWAFATAAALESKLLIGGKVSARSLKPVSAQNIMDCTARMFGYSTAPCQGGSVGNAFQLASKRGMTPTAAYRYRPTQGGADVNATAFQKMCDRALTTQDARAGLVQITGNPTYSAVAPTKAALMQALISQPTVSYLAVDYTFQHYSGGIWSSWDCAGIPPNHALLVVGYSTERAGQEYFLVKNSLGAGWGEQGFGRIAMTDDGMCGMYQTLNQPGTTSFTNVIKH